MPTDLEVAVDVVRAGAHTAERWFRRPVGVRSKRSVSDPVTEADLAAQRAMVDVVERLRPGDGLLGEEQGLATGGPRRWLLDPVDGTVAFLAGLPQWSSAACLREGGRTLVSAIYDPIADELFCAEHGGGASLNGSPIATSGPPELRRAVVRTWCNPDVAAEPGYLPALNRLALAAGTLIAGSSGSLGLAWLACGRIGGWAELYPPDQQKDWDWFPGELLVSEAGGSTLETANWRIAAASDRLRGELAATVGEG